MSKMYQGDIPFEKDGSLAAHADPNDPADRKRYKWKPNYTFKMPLRICGEGQGWSGFTLYLTPVGSKDDTPAFRMCNSEVWRMLNTLRISQAVTEPAVWTFTRRSTKYTLMLA